MARRHLTTGITLLVLVGILVVGVVLGSKSLFAPLPDSGQAAETPSPTCATQTVKKGQRIRSTQVQVSVFNGGTRSGLADETLQPLVKRGFTAGDAGNAPSGTEVKRVRVFTTTENDLSATLVPGSSAAAPRWSCPTPTSDPVSTWSSATIRTSSPRPGT